LLKVGSRKLENPPELERSSVVEKHLGAADLLVNAAERRAEAFLVGDIREKRLRGAAGTLDFGQDAAHGLVVTSHKCDSEAPLRKPNR
jgi:hypothetical protein